MQKKKEILERANNKPNYSITHDMTNIYTEAFSIFFKIGAFTIGGGYAMVPLIEDEIVTKRRWIAKEDFIDLLAIAQSAPGILAVNISIFIGYRLRGIRGSIVTALGTILPSFLIILAIALFFHNFKDNVYVERIFKGIRPAVVARSDFQYGQIRQNQPLHDMDSYCLGSAYLVIGLLPYLDYHCCRYRRIPVRKAALPENQQLKIKQNHPTYR